MNLTLADVMLALERSRGAGYARAVRRPLQPSRYGMILEDGVSGLVRLSDALKVSLADLAWWTERYLTLREPHINELRRLRDAARQAMSAPQRLVPDMHPAIPPAVTTELAGLESRIDSHALGTILLSCFTMESYVNTLAHYLIGEPDLIGLVGKGRERTSEILLDAIKRLGPEDKWKAVACLRGGRGFEKGESPWQDFKILFKYRNDRVHDKVLTLTESTDERRYNGKLPPLMGTLTLRHGLYAANTYWRMALSVLELADVPRADFHRHYDLSPWGDVSEEDLIRLAVARENL